MGIDLHKRAESAGIVLKKRGVAQTPPMRVGAAWDISGSAQGMYYDGTMQTALDRVLGFAMNIDPSHRLDNFVFDDRHAQLPLPATPNNYKTYIRDQVLTEDKIRKWGSTCYAGVIHQMQDHYFGRPGMLSRLGGLFHKSDLTAKIPALAFLFTDGDNDSDDYEPAREAFERASNSPIFFCLVGIGRHSFEFLREMEQREEDCEFVNLSNLNISDEELYQQIVSPKLVAWLKRQAG
jgi:hypothetical protein